MRLSGERIKNLQAILHDELGLDYSDEQAQEAGMAIMRFVAAKAHRKQQIKNGDKQNGKTNTAAA